MRLFKIFRKEKTPAPPADGFPELRTGMRIEVLTPTQVPLFTGRVRILSASVLEIRAEQPGSFLPRAVYGQPVVLQGFLEDGAPFTLHGSVGPNGPDFWRIERLRLPQDGQHRGYFRQQSGIEGQVSPAAAFQGQKYPCKVLDISGSGARVVTNALFRPESFFRLNFTLPPGESPFSILCLVKRVHTLSRPGSQGKQFEYGCQFTKLSAEEQERLVQAVFALQRKTLQAQRNR